MGSHSSKLVEHACCILILYYLLPQNSELLNIKMVLNQTTKHNLATTVDKEKVLAAYTDVMSDQKADINWAFFNYTDSTIGVKATGKEFSDFKTHFTPDDRGFGYIKITTGDELSKRSKFVFCTWIGPNVSVMKKAKMGTDKAFVKEVIQNISVELQPESLSEVDAGYFETECRKAGGANYGTGKRD